MTFDFNKTPKEQAQDMKEKLVNLKNLLQIRDSIADELNNDINTTCTATLSFAGTQANIAVNKSLSAFIDSYVISQLKSIGSSYDDKLTLDVAIKAMDAYIDKEGKQDD